MRKKTKFLALFAGLGIFSLFFATYTAAEPSEPARVINHITRECALIGTGDECMVCSPTGDWELLSGTCPEGYTQLDKYAPNACVFSGNPICCQNSPDLYPCQGKADSPTNKVAIAVGMVILLLAVSILFLKFKQGAAFRRK